MTRVLVVDDEPQILRALKIILRDAGFEVLQAATVEEALDAAALRPPAAAIIDLVLPDGDGIEVTAGAARVVEDADPRALSAVGEEDEKVRALEAGADDYVTKPFGPRELVARLQAALRRADPGVSEPVLRADGLELDLAAHTVRVDGEEVHLTPIEFKLLRALARQPRAADDAPLAARRGVGPEYADDVQVLRVHIANLRRKIERRRRRATSAPTRASATASRPEPLQRRADLRRHLGPEQLDRPHHVGVRQRADAHLQQEAVVLEDLVLEQDLLDDLVGAADEVRAAQLVRGEVLLAAQRRPAALAADPVHHRLERREADVLTASCERLGDEAVRVDRQRPVACPPSVVARRCSSANGAKRSG